MRQLNRREALAAIFGSLASLLLACIDDETIEKARSTPRPQVTDTSLEVATFGVSFFTIRDNHRVMTEAQWNIYWGTLIGKRVRWTGWVSDVWERDERGGQVYVDMDRPDSLITFDVSFWIPKEDVLKYDKKQRITFEGTLSSVWTFMSAIDISLDDVEMTTE